MLGLVSIKDKEYSFIINYFSWHNTINIILSLIILLSYTRGDISKYFNIDIQFNSIMICTIPWTIFSIYVLHYTFKKNPDTKILVINVSMIVYMTLCILINSIIVLSRTYIMHKKLIDAQRWPNYDNWQWVLSFDTIGLVESVVIFNITG